MVVQAQPQARTKALLDRPHGRKKATHAHITFGAQQAQRVSKGVAFHALRTSVYLYIQSSLTFGPSSPCRFRLLTAHICIIRPATVIPRSLYSCLMGIFMNGGRGGGAGGRRHGGTEDTFPLLAYTVSLPLPQGPLSTSALGVLWSSLDHDMITHPPLTWCTSYAFGWG